MKESTTVWLLAATVVIAAMVGYSLWKARVKESLKDRHGLVSGIIYDEEKPSAMIDEKIVHEGDTVFGVKVVKIHSDKVEFEKNGKSWSQKIQEKPGLRWPEADND